MISVKRTSQFLSTTCIDLSLFVIDMILTMSHWACLYCINYISQFRYTTKTLPHVAPVFKTVNVKDWNNYWPIFFTVYAVKYWSKYCALMVCSSSTLIMWFVQTTFVSTIPASLLYLRLLVIIVPTFTHPLRLIYSSKMLDSIPPIRLRTTLTQLWFRQTFDNIWNEVCSKPCFHNTSYLPEKVLSLEMEAGFPQCDQ